MLVSEILLAIDHEIALLQRARALLAGAAAIKPGKPAAVPAARRPAKKKKNLTPQGRQLIAEAVKRRWAEHRKAASGK